MDFDVVYEEQFQPIYQYIRYMVSNLELAEDLTQEAFLRIYKTDLTKVNNISTIVL